ncbi:MAG: hypothetical protein NC122_10615 [Faecalibacterium sp.]|nr:hypothetical protein [Ruminococcus sp.]MCM1392618.1 hypothetical protein [Ruminococcus sp.]MCM1486642.1 hypothetical protein [Faecalibacterium sp.]
MKKFLKKYLILRFNVYYVIYMIAYVYISVAAPIINDIFFYDTIEYNFEAENGWENLSGFVGCNCVVMTIVLLWMVIFAVCLTQVLLKMNKDKHSKDDRESVFDIKVVYGPIRKLLIVNVVLFLAVQIGIAIERTAMNRVVFAEDSMAFFILQLVSFGNASIMSGIFLELKNNRKKYVR